MPAETPSPLSSLSDPTPLVAGVQAGDRIAIATALNLVEDRRPTQQQKARRLLAALRRTTLGRAAANHTAAGHSTQNDGASKEGASHGDASKKDAQVTRRIGITGPPGVGKSSLINALCKNLRGRGIRVGVVAVDPSSTTSGGAILGDRTRMDNDAEDDGLFIRSIANGGRTGGLAWAAPAMGEVLAAAFDVVLLETTGVGQTETEIQHLVDLVVVVVQPGSGDTLQFLKAGIMEIPDLLVVNKADLESLANRAESDLRHSTAAAISNDGGAESPTLMRTSALTGEGIDALVDALLSAALRRDRNAGWHQWLLTLFTEEYGTHGVRTLGGPTAVRKQLQQLDRTTDDALSALGAQYLAALHGDLPNQRARRCSATDHETAKAAQSASPKTPLDDDGIERKHPPSPPSSQPQTKPDDAVAKGAVQEETE